MRNLYSFWALFTLYWVQLNNKESVISIFCIGQKTRQRGRTLVVDMVNMRGKDDINREIQPLFQQRLNFKICKNITSVYSILKEFQEHWRLHSRDSCIVLENS